MEALVRALFRFHGGPTLTQAPPPTEPSTTSTPTTDPLPTETASATVTALADVKSPVIQIEAQGSLVAPRVEMQMKVARTGSGFIIGDSGIAPA